MKLLFFTTESGRTYPGVDDKSYPDGPPPKTDSAATSQPLFSVMLLMLLYGLGSYLT